MTVTDERKENEESVVSKEGTSEEPIINTVTRVVERSLASLIAGGLFGATRSIFTDSPLALHAASNGLLVGYVGLSYFVTLEVLGKLEPKYKGTQELHVVTGALAGTVSGAIVYGPRRAVFGTLLLSGLGFGGFHLYNQAMLYRENLRERVEEEYAKKEN